MKQVTKDEFFEALRAEEAKGKDIMPSITNGPFPYQSTWKSQRQPYTVFGKSEGRLVAGSGLTETDYFLEEEWHARKAVAGA